MKNRFTGRLGRLFLNAVSLESRSPGAVVMKTRNTTDTGLKPSSMTSFYNGKKPSICFGGFTLIELLVVVLIIGILAAIAIPQYEKSVNKSRVARWFPMGRTMATAMDSYYLANNGTYPTSFDELDVLPAGGTDFYGKPYTTGPSIFYSATNGGPNQSVPGVRVRFTLHESGICQAQVAFTDDHEMWLNFYSNTFSANKALRGKIECLGNGKGEEVCKSLSSSSTPRNNRFYPIN